MLKPLTVWITTNCSVQLLSPFWLSMTPWIATCQASLSITNSQSSNNPMPVESVIPSNHLILYCPFLLLLSIFTSIRVFFNESGLDIRWSKYWSFNFSISPSNEYSGLISFRIDWFDLLAVQGTLKSFLQHHNSVQFKFSHSVVYDSFQPQGLQLARPPYPSPTPRIYSNSCLLSRRCHPTISSSVIPFSSRLQSFSASGSFLRSQFFTGGQSIGVSASASVLPMNIQDWFTLRLTGWISLQSKRLARVFSNTTLQKHHFGAQLSL